MSLENPSIESLFDNQPKGEIFRCVADTSEDAIAFAARKLNNEWNSFLTKEGAFASERKAKKPVSEEKPRVTRLKKRQVQEDAITSKIGHEISRYLGALPANHPARTMSLNCKVDAGIESENLVGTSEKRNDLRFETCHGENMHLVIEAKVICSEPAINERYLSDSGLNRFTRREEPYSKADVAGLMAYMPKINAKDLTDKIHEASQKVKSFSESRCLQIGDKEPSEKVLTKHSKDTGGGIWMLHLQLVFPALEY
jgi:hypothetical protein